MFRYGVVVMFVFGCFRISRNVAAAGVAGLVLLLAASACAPAVQDTPEPALPDVDRVETVLGDVAPEPPAAVSVPVSDGATTLTGPADLVGQVPDVPPPTPTTAPATTVEPTPTPTTAPATTVEPTPTPTTAPATTVEPTTPEPTTTDETAPTTPTTTTTPAETLITPPTRTAPPGVSWFPAPYPVPDSDPPPAPGVTIVSITHHDAVWEAGVPEVTFRWTLHLSSGDNVERSWTPDPGYETTIWAPERIAAGTPYWYSEDWFWDSDPVYGPHPMLGAGMTRSDIFNRVGLYNADDPEVIRPPSGYYILDVSDSLLMRVWYSTNTIESVNLFYELWFALGSMSMQDQRALYEKLQDFEHDATVLVEDGVLSERVDYLVEFLLTTQPRWTCRIDAACRLA